MVCLFSVFASLKYFFWILFSFYRLPKYRTKLTLNLNSWIMIYLDIIALFFVVFLMYNFHLSLAAQYCFIRQRKYFLISSFWIGFTCVFHLYFLVFSLKISIIVKECKFCCIWFRFVLWSKKLTRFFLFNFLAVSHAAKKNIISCFLTSYTHQVEFFW